MPELSTQLARIIITKLGESGTPPESGVEYFTVGLNPYLRIIESEYLSDFISQGGSSFKLVVGSYGGGKTHFLYSVRNVAWRHNFLVSYVSLSPAETPFDKLELVYKGIVNNIMYPVPSPQLPTHGERGIEGFIRVWLGKMRDTLGEDELKLQKYAQTMKSLESTSFTNAVRGAFQALVQGDEGRFVRVLQWLKCEGYDRNFHPQWGIVERIDRSTAFRMLRSLTQWIEVTGYSGLVLLFDEAERALSLVSSKTRRQALDNLRQLVDECGNSRIPATMMFYAIPDENQLLEGREEVYEALKQRLRGTLTQMNPSGVKIDLDNLELTPHEFLVEVGQKLTKIYQTLHHTELPTACVEETASNVAEAAYEERYADIGYRRLFVKGFIAALGMLRVNPHKEVDRKTAEALVRENLVSLRKTAREESNSHEY